MLNSTVHMIYVLSKKEQIYCPVTYIYPIIVFDVDISFLANKVFHYVQVASCFSCHMQRYHLKRKEVSPNQLNSGQVSNLQIITVQIKCDLQLCTSLQRLFKTAKSFSPIVHNSKSVQLPYGLCTHHLSGWDDVAISSKYAKLRMRTQQ